MDLTMVVSNVYLMKTEPNYTVEWLLCTVEL